MLRPLLLPILRASALALGFSVVTACGGSGPGGPGTDPPTDPGDGPPDDPTAGPPPAGMALYAVDLDNRLLLLGTGNPGTPTRIVPITGLPILKRIVGVDFRPSDGRLYGVGNDSRVYVLDTVTAAATPVAAEPFDPPIDIFEVHFGMSFDPVSDRIRLIVAESGANYEIDPDDGTATLQAQVHYAATDPNAGATPSISGIGFAGASVPATLHASSAPSLRGGPCEDLLYAIDADLAELVMSCDPDQGEFESIGPIAVAIARCSEIKVAPDGNIFAIVLAESGNLLLVLDRLTGHATSQTPVNDDSPIQTFGFVPEAGEASLRVLPAVGLGEVARTDPVAASLAASSGRAIDCASARR
jgi:uncharacterized protein DUF4394